MTKDGPISIWFFVGLLLTVYGILILGAGLHALVRPPKSPLALFWLHADIWWGGLLLALGAGSAWRSSGNMSATASAPTNSAWRCERRTLP